MLCLFSGVSGLIGETSIVIRKPLMVKQGEFKALQNLE